VWKGGGLAALKLPVIIIILCSLDSGNVNAQSTPLSESRQSHVRFYYYTGGECIVDFFLQSGVEKLLVWAAGH